MKPNNKILTEFKKPDKKKWKKNKTNKLSKELIKNKMFKESWKFNNMKKKNFLKKYKKKWWKQKWLKIKDSNCLIKGSWWKNKSKGKRRKCLKRFKSSNKEKLIQMNCWKVFQCKLDQELKSLQWTNLRK